MKITSQDSIRAAAIGVRPIEVSLECELLSRGVLPPVKVWVSYSCGLELVDRPYACVLTPEWSAAYVAASRADDDALTYSPRIEKRGRKVRLCLYDVEIRGRKRKRWTREERLEEAKEIYEQQKRKKGLSDNAV